MKVSVTKVESFVEATTATMSHQPRNDESSPSSSSSPSLPQGSRKIECSRTVVENDAIAFIEAALSENTQIENTGDIAGHHGDEDDDVMIAKRLWKPSGSVVTSIPDVCEVSMGVDQWKDWFSHAAYIIMRQVHPQQVAIFYQTDIKVDGRWIDKGFLVQKVISGSTWPPLLLLFLSTLNLSLSLPLKKAAEKAGAHLLWHKVVMITKPNEVKFGRPGYSHMLCFSKEKLEEIAYSTRKKTFFFLLYSSSFFSILLIGLFSLPPTADVIDRGEMTWAKAMGLKACVVAVRYIKKFVPGCDLVIDPFCGKGSILAVANEFGLDSLGVELSTKRCRDAILLKTTTLENEAEGKQRQKKQKWKDSQRQKPAQETEPSPETSTERSPASDSES